MAVVLAGGALPGAAMAGTALPGAASTSPAAADASPSPSASDDTLIESRSHTKASSLWVLVNKRNALRPKTYKPKGLVTPKVAKAGKNTKMRRAAARALEKLARASKRATGKKLTLVSGYRSYSYQKKLYRGYVRSDGKKSADKYSARAGYSEHQTGLVADIGQAGGRCTLKTCFGTTKTGKWVAKNAWKYGFIVRYPKGKTKVTGYAYEPWHLRYVGTELATYMHEHGISTLERALKEPNAPKYR